MTGILFVIKTIYSNQFKWNYVKNKSFFLDCLLNLWKLNSIFNISEKKMSLVALVFPQLKTAKDAVS